MSSAFKRTLSLPTSRRNQKACHVRSSSLPCRSHPLLTQLQDQLQKMRSWIILSTDPSAQNMFSGLKMLKTLHDTADDFLHLPQTLDVVRRNEQWANHLLDDQLKFLDVFCVVGSILSSLREHQMSALISLRRRRRAETCNSTETILQSFINHRKKSTKEMNRLTTLLKTIAKPPPVSISNDGHLEIFSVFNDVKALTVSVVVAVISGLRWTPKRGIEVLVGLNKRSRSTSSDCIKELNDADSAMEDVLRLRGRDNEMLISKALATMNVLEDCLSDLETVNDSVFRSLINTRVSILNILTQ